MRISLIMLSLVIGQAASGLVSAQSDRPSYLTPRSTTTPKAANYIDAYWTYAAQEPELFNHAEQRLRTAKISGVEVVVDLSDGQSKVTQAILGGAGKPAPPTDLKELEIVAQKVVIRGRAALPGASVSICAHELVFEDAPQSPSQLVTTPVAFPAPAGTVDMATLEYLRARPELFYEWYIKSQLMNETYRSNYDHYRNVFWLAGGTSIKYDARKRIAAEYRPLRASGPVDIEAALSTADQAEESKEYKYFARYQSQSGGYGRAILYPGDAGYNTENPGDRIDLPNPKGTVYAPRFWPKSVRVGQAGHNGLPAGDVTLRVAKLGVVSRHEWRNLAVKRIVLKGGAGQTGGQGSQGAAGVTLANLGPKKPNTSDPNPLATLCSHNGLPVYLPSSFAHHKINGQVVDNDLMLQGLPGIEPGASGMGGAAGDLNIIASNQFPDDWETWVDLNPGDAGADADASKGGPPGEPAKYYEFNILAEDEAPDTDEQMFFFPGRPNPLYDEVEDPKREAAYQEAYKLARKERDRLDAQWKEQAEAAKQHGEPVPARQILDFPYNTAQRKWLDAPRRFRLVLKEAKVGRSTPAPQPDELPASYFGEIVPTDAGWARPEAMIKSVAWAREHYLINDTETTFQTCLLYLRELNRQGKNSDPRMRAVAGDMVAMMRNLNNGRDYFGKPPGWAPRLSLEAELADYKAKIDDAVKAYYLAALFEAAWKHEAGRIQRSQAVEEHFRRKRSEHKAAVARLAPLIEQLEVEEKQLGQDLAQSLEVLQQAEDHLVGQVENREQIRRAYLTGISAMEKYTELMAGVSSDAFSETGPWGSAVGYTLDIVNSDLGAVAASMRDQLQNRPSVPQGRVADYFEGMIEEDEVAQARRNLQELNPVDFDSAKDFLAELESEELCGVLAGATARAVRNQIKAELQRSEEGARLYDVMFAMDNPYDGLNNSDASWTTWFATWRIKDAATRVGAVANVDDLNDQAGAEIQNSDFEAAFDVLTYQVTLKGMLTAKILRADQLLTISQAQLQQTEDGLRSLENHRAAALNQPTMPIEVVSAVRRIEREAEDRLLYQKYCLIQAYHYRILKPCPVDYGAAEATKAAETLLRARFPDDDATRVRLRQRLGSEWSEYIEGDEDLPVSGQRLDDLLTLLKELHEQDLKRIAQAIKEEMPPQQRGGLPRRAPLTKQELAALNAYGRVTIRLENRGILVPRDTNARLIAVHFAEPGPDLDDSESGLPEFGELKVLDPKRFNAEFSYNMTLTCEVGDDCVLRSGRNSYRFTRPRRDDGHKDVVASFAYSTDGRNVHVSKPLGSDDGLLMDVLNITDATSRAGQQGRLRAFMGARTTLTIIKSAPPEVDIPVENLTLWIDIAVN